MAFETPPEPKNPVDETLAVMSEGFFVAEVKEYSNNEYDKLQGITKSGIIQNIMRRS